MAQGEALSRANAFCEELGRKAIAVSTSSSAQADLWWGQTNAFSYQFLCLTEDDPRYKTNPLAPVPDTVIEDRR